MTLDGQVLMLALLAISLKFIIWCLEPGIVEGKDQSHRREERRLNTDRRQALAGIRPTGAKDGHV